MGFLNLPTGQIVKGQKYEVSVNKTELANNEKVSNDTYFSNSDVWSTFTATFQSINNPKHIEVMTFDASLPSPLSYFLVSDHAVGSFRILNFVINDHDGGKLELSRDDINVADYVIDMPLKIAPSQLITSVNSQTEFEVADGSNYESGFKVILFNTETNSFEPDEPRELSLVVGNTLHLDSAFVTTVTTHHRLRFPKINKCNSVQATKFYFNS